MPTTAKPVTLAGAVHSHCRCLECRLGHAVWYRDRRTGIANGTWQPWTDPAPVREHIEKLHAGGMSYNVIAHLAKVKTGDIQRIRTNVGDRPRAERMRPDTARAILAVQLHFSRLPGKSHVPSLGTQRRVQALRAIGWTPRAISDRAGIGSRTLYSATMQSSVEAATHLRIAALYEELHDQHPAEHGILPSIVARTRRYAAAQGWAVPAAWTDIDTDEHPNRRIRGARFAKTTPGDRGRDVIEATAELAAAGATREEVAARIGISWEAVSAAHRRADVPVPAVLAASGSPAREAA